MFIFKGNCVFKTVTTAKAGVKKEYKDWIPAFAGMTQEAFMPWLKA
jgi:hypothetical protein